MSNAIFAQVDSTLTGKLAGELLDFPALADKMGVSHSTIRRWWYEGSLPLPVRVGRRAIRWRTSDIQAWISAGCPRGAESGKTYSGQSR